MNQKSAFSSNKPQSMTGVTRTRAASKARPSLGLPPLRSTLIFSRMTLLELKTEAACPPDAEMEELATYLFALRRAKQPGRPREISRKLDDTSR